MYPKEGIPHPALQDDGMVQIIVTTTTPVTFPAGVTRAEIMITGGGSSSGVSPALTNPNAGHAGATGISIIDVDPSVTYSAVIGSGGLTTAGGALAGGATSFSGRGITTMIAQGGPAPQTEISTTNIAQAIATGCQISIPGGMGFTVNSGTSLSVGGAAFMGGLSRYNAPTGYGDGAPNGGVNSGAVTSLPGMPGRLIIRYKGKV